MATAKKTKAGNWRILVYDYTDENGKKVRKSFTAPTKAEVEYIASQWVHNEKGKEKNKPLTVGDVIDQYIEKCKSLDLSPTTIHNYEVYRENGFKNLMSINVDDLTDEICQNAIDEERERPKGQCKGFVSAKTVRNEWGLIAASLKKICKKSFDVSLPKSQRTFKELPTPEQVMEMIKGTSIELPCLLSMWLSFSLSEIRGFKCSSIRNGCIYVDQVLVDVDNIAVIKENAKTATRKRKQSLPPYIMELINNTESYQNFVKTEIDGLLIPLTRHQIYNKFQRLCEKNDIQMTFHDLRHMFASIMLTRLQIPEKVVQDEGGWSTDHVMKTVYSNTFSDSRMIADKMRDDYFKSLI